MGCQDETRDRETVTIEPNWDAMRDYVRNVFRTDPAAARRIADAMGREAPQLEEPPALTIAHTPAGHTIMAGDNPVPGCENYDYADEAQDVLRRLPAGLEVLQGQHDPRGTIVIYTADDGWPEAGIVSGGWTSPTEPDEWAIVTTAGDVWTRQAETCIVMDEERMEELRNALEVHGA